MKRRSVRVLAVLIAAAALLAQLAACSNGQGRENASPSASATNAAEGTVSQGSQQSDTEQPVQLEPVTLKVMLWGDKPNQFDDVVAEFERRTKDTLNVKLDVTFTPLADYGNKLKLRLASGSDVDLAFDAPWLTMPGMIAQDSYLKLDGYFNNPEYPGLQKAFNETLLNNNKFQGPDGNANLYGVPLGQMYSGISVLYYRKDLAKKYGMEEIGSYEDLMKFYDQVKANEPNLVPFSFQNGQYPPYIVLNGEAGDGMLRAQHGIVNVDKATLYVKDNKIVGAYIAGEDPAPALKDFPEPFRSGLTTTGQLIDREKTTAEWNAKGYIEKNAINQKDAQSLFTAGKAASYVQDLSNMPTLQGALSASVPGGELGTFILDKKLRELQPGIGFTDYKFWNFLSIPATSKNAERAMLFLDWLFGDAANHDLFELGIEGKHWEKAGDEGRYKIPDGVDPAANYTFPGFQLTWNPNYIHLPATLPEGYDKYYDFVSDVNSFVKSPIAGFSFNGEPVKDAAANPAFAKIADDSSMFLLGLNADVEGAHAELQKKYASDKQLQKDIQAIKAEIIKQTQAYMDNQ